MINIDEFMKKSEFLVCVDSDGCAMDTMNIKHFHCFGPCMVDEWELEPWRNEILARWNDINLFTMTRGVNRFKGLAMILGEISEKYRAIEGVDKLIEWAESSRELSNSALEAAIFRNPDAVALKKALSWSIAVNAAIKKLPESEIKPFPLAREGLELAHGKADVAIVSSANLDAVLEEWKKHSLLPHTDIVMAQNAGSKAACISALLKKGYDRANVLMCGDAPGDLAAAEKNGVLFFPILVGKERESWQELMDSGLDALVSHSYAGEYQERKKAEFYKNLGQ